MTWNPLRRPPPVAADVGEGFVATEAPALQGALRGALRVGETAPVSGQVQLQRGAAGRVVVEWRRRYVGFAPADRAGALSRQLEAVGRAPLVAPAEVYQDGTIWRVWVGPPREGQYPVVGPGYDELEPSPPSIFGIPLARREPRRP